MPFCFSHHRNSSSVCFHCCARINGKYGVVYGYVSKRIHRVYNEGVLSRMNCSFTLQVPCCALGLDVLHKMFPLPFRFLMTNWTRFVLSSSVSYLRPGSLDNSGPGCALVRVSPVLCQNRRLTRQSSLSQVRFVHPFRSKVTPVIAVLDQALVTFRARCCLDLQPDRNGTADRSRPFC